MRDTSLVFTVIGSLPVVGVARLTQGFHPSAAATLGDKLTRWWGSILPRTNHSSSFRQSRSGYGGEEG